MLQNVSQGYQRYAGRSVLQTLWISEPCTRAQGMKAKSPQSCSGDRLKFKMNQNFGAEIISKSAYQNALKSKEGTRR